MANPFDRVIWPTLKTIDSNMAEGTKTKRHSPSKRPTDDRKAPVSFLDSTWSWSAPSTWPLSVKLLPFPVACLALFLGVYIQHFLPADTAMRTCIAEFDYGIPISKIEDLATSLATHDWEQGTAAEALLELHNPELSVFGQQPFPRSNIPTDGMLKTRALEYILPKIEKDTREISIEGWTLSNNTWGISDPASLGVFAVMAAAAQEETKGSGHSAWRDSVYGQMLRLLNDAPRYGDDEANQRYQSLGAMSHRTEVAELWSDAIFMVPPFMAYLAVWSGAQSIALRVWDGRDEWMDMAVEQISLYRDVLLIAEGENRGAWKHIVGPSEMADPGAWSTGNGWAAYGMARVRATIAGWKPLAEVMKEETSKLDAWIAEIIDTAIRTDNHESGLLRNYLGDDSWFGETAGTALIAAAAYRFGIFLEPGRDRERYLAWANRKREIVFKHVDAEDIAAPAVNSLKHAQREPLD